MLKVNLNGPVKCHIKRSGQILIVVGNIALLKVISRLSHDNTNVVSALLKVGSGLSLGNTNVDSALLKVGSGLSLGNTNVVSALLKADLVHYP